MWRRLPWYWLEKKGESCCIYQIVCCICRAVFTRCLWSTGLVRLTRKSSTAFAILPLPWLGSGTWKTRSFCLTSGKTSWSSLNLPSHFLLTFQPLSFFSFLDILAWVLGGSARRNTGSASRGGWDWQELCHLFPSSLQGALVRGRKSNQSLKLSWCETTEEKKFVSL